MRIAVLGTGVVGKHLAAAFERRGHDVRVGTRDPEETMARAGGRGPEDPPFASWSADHPGVGLEPFARAAAHGEVVVNAVDGAVSLAVLDLAGAHNLAGKVLVDISNPLDFSSGFPPTLFVKDTDSLGEQIQRAHPQAKVVKTLNTLTAHLMVNPQVLEEETTVFLSGDDAGAKATVAALLESLGHTDVIDLGDITTARGTEMMTPVWLRLMRALGTSHFNYRIVR
ncbi:MAG TPA: NAD(P)-binding domain-containing protein [Pedococcus sp.]